MRRVAHLLMLLYPRAWRERYRDEFAALLDDVRPGCSDLFDILKGAICMCFFRSPAAWPLWQMVAISVLAGLLMAAAAAFILPPSYTSTAVLRMRAESVALRSSIPELALTAFSSAPLTQVVRDLRLYEAPGIEMQGRVDRLKRHTAVMTVPSTSAFTLTFEHRDPALAQRVTRALMDTLMTASAGGTAASRATLEIVDAPSLPSRPSSPSMRELLLFGGATGLFAGLLARILLRRGRTAATV